MNRGQGGMRRGPPRQPGQFPPKPMGGHPGGHMGQPPMQPPMPGVGGMPGFQQMRMPPQPMMQPPMQGGMPPMMGVPPTQNLPFPQQYAQKGYLILPAVVKGNPNYKN